MYSLYYDFKDELIIIIIHILKAIKLIFDSFQPLDLCALHNNNNL